MGITFINMMSLRGRRGIDIILLYRKRSSLRYKTFRTICLLIPLCLFHNTIHRQINTKGNNLIVLDTAAHFQSCLRS